MTLRRHTLFSEKKWSVGTPTFIIIVLFFFFSFWFRSLKTNEQWRPHQTTISSFTLPPRLPSTSLYYYIVCTYDIIVNLAVEIIGLTQLCTGCTLAGFCRLFLFVFSCFSLVLTSRVERRLTRVNAHPKRSFLLLFFEKFRENCRRRYYNIHGYPWEPLTRRLKL